LDAEIKTEDGRRRTEGRRQRTEGRGRRAEDRGPFDGSTVLTTGKLTAGRRWKTEDGGQRTEGRRQTTVDRRGTRTGVDSSAEFIPAQARARSDPVFT